MAQKQKHPVGRVRTTIAGVDLFFPEKSAGAKRRRVKKFLHNTVYDENSNLMMMLSRFSIPDGYVKKAGLLRRKKHFLGRLRGQTKATTLHEFSHLFGIGKNDLLTANAITGYFYGKKGLLPILPEEYQAKKRIMDMEHYVKAGKRYKQPRYEVDNESGLGFLGKALSDIGWHFGSFAEEKEQAWKKPASGLFLIREVSNGKPVAQAMKEIEAGKFDVEIRAFAKKHLANLHS